MKKIRFFDTTLRDGEQTAGVRISSDGKVDIARQLEKYGIDVIEAGFPAASASEAATVAKIAAALRRSAVCALCRADRADIDAAYNAVKGAVRPVLHIFIATSELHMTYKLKKTPSEVLAAIKDSISYAASLCPEVEFSAEDATRSDREFLLKAVNTAIEAGATVINLPDTVGYALPYEYADLFNFIVNNAKTNDKVIFSAHCHNDLGLATANSLAAATHGATQIEGTINGVGERAGNAPLEEIIMAIETRGEVLGLSHSVNIAETAKTSKLVSSLTGVSVPVGKAIVGKNAYLHQSGVHQHGVLCNPLTYQIISPEKLGFSSVGMPLGKLSGRHAFADKLTALGFEFADDAVSAMFTTFKRLADKKTDVTDDDVLAIVGDYLDSLTGAYKLDTFQIQSGNHIQSTAMITLRRTADDATLSEAALGQGPIDAAFNAIDRIVGKTNIKLESYNIKAVTEGADALGEVSVKIRVEDKSFAGRGVSSDIIKASIKAYINAVNKLLFVGE